jgi:ribosomal protein S18 acetylase RimI-like enzyme
MSEALSLIESYYDAVPRSAARVEQLGPFTLFVNTGPGWTYYARPTPGEGVFSPEDVLQVCRRQEVLGVPQAFEWVKETTPALEAAVQAAGLEVVEHPLLVLDLEGPQDVSGPSGIDIRLVLPEDDIALISAVAGVAFGAAGMAIGPEGARELRAAAARRGGSSVEFERQLLAGATVMAAAFENGLPVSVGSHNPVGKVSEIVGVGTLPAFRRRGLAAAVVRLLIADALRRGVETIFLTADDAAVARLYAGLGFREIATACVAEKP